MDHRLDPATYATFTPSSTEDVLISFSEFVARLQAGQRVVLEPSDAADICESVGELAEEQTLELNRKREALSQKPRFFKFPGGHYVQVEAIATILEQASGDICIVTVTGGVINIDALSWRMMRETFESSIDLKVMQTSSLVKSA
jgi:hypothetical protein